MQQQREGEEEREPSKREKAIAFAKEHQSRSRFSKQPAAVSERRPGKVGKQPQAPDGGVGGRVGCWFVRNRFAALWGASVVKRQRDFQGQNDVSPEDL